MPHKIIELLKRTICCIINIITYTLRTHISMVFHAQNWPTWQLFWTTPTDLHELQLLG